MVKANRKRRPQPLPATEKRVKTSLVLRPSLWRAVRIQALHEGRSAAFIVEQLIQDYLATVKKEG